LKQAAIIFPLHKKNAEEKERLFLLEKYHTSQKPNRSGVSKRTRTPVPLKRRRLSNRPTDVKEKIIKTVKIRALFFWKNHL